MRASTLDEQRALRAALRRSVDVVHKATRKKDIAREDAGPEGVDGLAGLAMPAVAAFSFAVVAVQGPDTLLTADAVCLHDDGILSFERDGSLVAAFAPGQWRSFIKVRNES